MIKSKYDINYLMYKMQNTTITYETALSQVKDLLTKKGFRFEFRSISGRQYPISVVKDHVADGYTTTIEIIPRLVIDYDLETTSNFFTRIGSICALLQDVVQPDDIQQDDE